MMARFWFRCLLLISSNKLHALACALTFNWVCSTAALANQFPVIIYPTSGSSNHFYGIPYSGYFTAINGTHFNASQYYESQKTEFHLSGLAAIFINVEWSIKLDWTFDNGFYSDLYQVDPSFLSKITLIRSHEKNTFEFSINNALWLGGNITEKACIDTLNRNFHCGTGLPWSDYQPYELSNDLELAVKLTLFF